MNVKKFAVVTTAAVVIFLAGCSSSSNETQAPVNPAPAQTSSSVKDDLDWSVYEYGTKERITKEIDNKDCDALRAESFWNLKVNSEDPKAFNAMGKFLDRTYAAICKGK